MGFSTFMNTTRVFLRTHKRGILIGAGVVLTLAAVCEAVRATSKAKDIIDECEYEKFESLGMPEEGSEDFHLTKSETLRAVWKCYILTVLLTGGAVTCMISSHIASNRTIGAMSAAYASLLETYNVYRDNVRKVVTNSENQRITHGTVHDIVASDKELVPEKLKSSLIISDGTEILFRDAYSAKGTGYFKMTMNDARKAVAKFNKWLMDNDRATLNDWYDFLGLGHSDLGDCLWWSWAEDGPLYLRAIPDDVDTDDDDLIITALGLASDEGASWFALPDINKGNI